MELTKIRRDRAVDEVYQALRQAILNSLMLPGERLNIEDLSHKLGVSLTPVRQAIQQLCTEGLIEVRPRSGTFVAQLSERNVEETFDIRCALECLAAEKAVERATADDSRRLRDLMKAMRKAVRTDQDRKEHEEANVEFHLILLRASGNQRLLEMYEALNAHIKIARIHRTAQDWLPRLREEQAEHEAIAAALEKRDAGALQEALRKHIMRAKDALVRSMRDRETRD
ncbi:MAG: GntR family transcriptional regulator [Bryobacteraceae bacterium]